MPYKVRAGKQLNHNGKMFSEGDVVTDVAPHVAADPSVAECLEDLSAEEAKRWAVCPTCGAAMLKAAPETSVEGSNDVILSS